MYIKEENGRRSYHVPLKAVILFLITLLIVLYFFNEQELFDRLLMILVPFIIGTSVKVGLISLGFFA